jgi:hypothetical protein
MRVSGRFPIQFCFAPGDMMGALLLIIGAALFIAIALWLAWGASQFSANILGKLMLAGIVLFFFYWVFFGNSNMAEAEFKRLCETEAKATIFKTVQLPADYFNEYGWPIKQSSKKAGISSEIAGHYGSVLQKTIVSEKPLLEKASITYKDLRTDETLGVITSFHYTPSYPFPVPGVVQGQDCKDKSFANDGYYKSFTLSIFKKQQ